MVMARVVVVGAGAMGLAAAYRAALAGHAVTVLEASDQAGGMAAHFDLAGLSIERFYHFICKTDQPTFDLLDELGLAGRLRWRPTGMGQYADGRLHKWGDPLALLTYPGLSLLEKLRYGLLAFVSARRERWDALEGQNARDWITRWVGPRVYARLWEPLLRLKFFEYADSISAAWIWTRVKRTGRSRRSLFQEELGYIEGGSATLVDALVDKITALGGAFHLATPARKVTSADGRVTGVETDGGFHPADAVILTIPTPLVSATVPDLPADWKARYDAIPNIGVACLVFRLRRPVTPYFWVNIADPDISIPGIIEFSNLRPTADPVVYVPYYMPHTHPKWGWDDAALIDEAFGYLRRLNPALTAQDVVAAHVARLRHAQPVCAPGFAATLPPVETPIAGLQIADTCFYYPEDRGIAESVRLGRIMAERIAV